MIYYRDKHCKLFEDDSNENGDLDNTNSLDDNIQLKTIDITSRDMKNNFQTLLKLSKDKLNSVISIAKLRFEDKLDTKDENSSSENLSDNNKNEQPIEKTENDVILNVMSSISDIKKMMLDLLSTATKLTDELLGIKNNTNIIKNNLDDIKDNQRRQNNNLNDIKDNLFKLNRKMDGVITNLEYLNHLLLNK